MSESLPISIPTGPGPSVSDPPVSTPSQSDPTPSQPTTPSASIPPVSNSTPSQQPSLSLPPSPSVSLPLTTSSQSPTTPSQIIVTDTGGGVITVTSILPNPTATPSQSAGASGAPKSFFDNKGAVGGVFAIVGLVGLAIIIALITIAIRRRRAQQFDDDVAEAAREAAHAKPPIFLDESADDGDNSYRTQNYVYSDNSHGTYSQPPMDHNRDAYNMSEMHRYANPITSAGAAGVGVMRARSRRDYDDTPTGAGLAGYGAGGGMGMYNTYGPGENQSPYPAFAAPSHPHSYDAYDNRYAPSSSHYNSQYSNTLVDTGVTTAAVAQRPSQHPDLAHQKSQGARSHVDGHPSSAESTPSQPESYASRYQPGYRPDPNNHPLPAPAQTTPYQGDDDDAYAGVSGGNHSPREQPTPAQRNSIIDDSDDETDDHQDSRRVLKVANE